MENAVARMRAIRHFAPQPLSDDDLHAILDAGRHAGSSKNLQRWQFVVVQDRDRLAELAAVGASAGHLAGGAAAIALVTPDPRAADAPLSIVWDLGRAAQNMMLVAWSRGVGSVPATVYDQPMCRRILGYPVDQHCEYILNFGYPADTKLIERAPRARWAARARCRSALGTLVKRLRIEYLSVTAPSRQIRHHAQIEGNNQMRLLAGPAAVLVLLLATACGGGSTTPTSAGGTAGTGGDSSLVPFTPPPATPGGPAAAASCADTAAGSGDVISMEGTHSLSPSDETIKTGDSVTWTNNSSTNHQISFASGAQMRVHPDRCLCVGQVRQPRHVHLHLHDPPDLHEGHDHRSVTGRTKVRSQNCAGSLTWSRSHLCEA